MSTGVLKKFEVALDISRSISNRGFTVVEGDTGNMLHITLTDDGAPVDLGGCRVMAVFSKSNGTACQDSGLDESGISVGGEANNEVTIELHTSSVAPGMVECELQVYSGADLFTLVTSAKFNFSCRRGILNEDTLQATSEYPLLVELMEKVEDATELAQAAAETAYTAAEYADMRFHAARHAAGGEDPVTPAAIGAAPVKHAHGNITAAGAIGTSANLPVFTGTNGVLGTKPAAAALSALGVTATAAEINSVGGEIDAINSSISAINNSITSINSSLTSIGSEIETIEANVGGKAASSHNHAASSITSGTLAVARGGTGITANPSMLTNLASTAAASVFAASPRPGVTGTLPIARGGTGATTAAAAVKALGALDITTIGATAITSSANLNSYTTPGTYYSATASVSATLTNTPVTAAGFKLIVMAGYVDGRVWQFLFAHEATLYLRYYNATAWSDWVALGENLAAKPVSAKNQSVATSKFVTYTAGSDETQIYNAGYTRRAAIAVAGVTASMFANVVIDEVSLAKGIFASSCNTYAGGVYIYANAVPSAAVTVKSIVAFPLG